MIGRIKPFETHINLELLKFELPTYVSTAKDVEIDRSVPEVFTEQVLAFWRSTPKEELKEWRKAARIVFGMTPNSAACERVFSLLAVMYGHEKDSVLADHIQASLMLRYNGRSPME